METKEETPQLDDILFLNALMENVSDSIYFKDRLCRLLRVSRKMALDLGYDDPSALVGQTDMELFGEDFGRKTMIDDLYIMETGKSIIGMVESHILPGGGTNWTSTTKFPLYGKHGEIIGIVGITREINELKRAELNLQYLATHDALTELPNRYLLLDRLEQCISRSSRQKTGFAMLYIDLDGFKNINDQYGHDVGDQMLRMAAGRMKNALRESDTVARMGGDEFVAILDGVDESEYVLTAAHKIRNVVGQSFDIANSNLRVTASIGISLYPEHGREASSLLKAADHAMYEAKKHKDYCAVYSMTK
jgi:diguanylate cyclase (GGDEF)-like protein/PAS domain S-box-containing protein